MLPRLAALVSIYLSIYLHAPRPSEEELQVPGCYPYGVRAMWSERSRHMRGGAVLGSSVGRLLAFCCAFPGTCHEAETGAKAAGGHR